MSGTRRSCMAWTMVLALALGAGAASASTAAAPFAEALAGLESGALRVRVEPSAAAARLGETLDYRIEADRGGYLTLLQLDAHGGVRVLAPSAAAPAGRITAGHALSLRGVPVAGPVGPARTYALATPEPLFHAASRHSDRVERQRLGRQAALGLAERIRQGVEAGGALGAAELRILGGNHIEYTVTEIVEQLVPTRAIRRPRIDFHHVLFAFDSALLTDVARQNLDVLAEALSTPDLAGERFLLGGHTDDVGSRGYNQGLSERRARSARRYLAEQWGIGADRIEVRGYGEERPLEAGDSQEARSMNRRVELEVVR